MYLIVGLGNPGKQYAGSRHNVGFMAVDRIAAEISVRLRKQFFHPVILGTGASNGNRFYLAKPLTYMNSSGIVFPRLQKRFSVGPENIILMCDNLDLKPGVIRVKRGGSHAGHNGLKSIINETGSSDFIRIFIGIGRPEPGETVVDHVLGTPNVPDKLMQGVTLAANAVRELIKGESIERVMNEFNRRNS